MDSFSKKVILVTGATGGLGKEFCRQFIADGAHLILTDLQKEPLESLVKELKGSGKVLGTFTGDVSNAEGAKAIYESTIAISKNIDVLVNNAGIANAGEFAEIPLDKVELLMQINLLSPMRLCHHFLPDMKKRGTGHIVNISSVAGLVPMPGGAPYSASKFGLKGFSDVLRTDYEPHGIKVSSVHPFFTKTAILDSARYGSAKIASAELPDFLVEDPESVIAETIRGIKKGEKVICPGMVAKSLDVSRRFFPELLNLMNKYLG